MLTTIIVITLIWIAGAIFLSVEIVTSPLVQNEISREPSPVLAGRGETEPDVRQPEPTAEEMKQAA